MYIFCIGLSKTGTLSLSKALELLGYKPIHYPDDAIYDSFYKKLFDEEYDVSSLGDRNAFLDIPFAFSFKGFYESYPESKFILTTREKNNWLKSCKKHMKKKKYFVQDKIRKLMYGSDVFNYTKMSETYDHHYKNVIDFFQNKPEQLLVYNVCEKEGWEPLLKFLDIENDNIIKTEFPHLNKTDYGK